MKARDISNQLRLLLPQLTDRFTDDVAVNSLTRAGTTITAVCATPHDMAVGDAVNITGAATPISISSFTRLDAVGTIVTSSDHDLTLLPELLDPSVASVTSQTVETEGAVEPEFNGTFQIISIPDRNTITVVMADAGPLVATGAPILLDGASALQDYNTLYGVTQVLDPFTFTFEQTTVALPDPVGTIIARTNPRISFAVNIQRILDSYTEKNVSELWAFVVLETAFATKSRSIESDAIDNLPRGTFYRQQMTQPFTVYVVVPVDESVSGIVGRDEVEDLRRPLFRSLLWSRFDSGLFVADEGTVVYATDGEFNYDTSVYVHAFTFQQTSDITDQDVVGPDLDVALRCIDMTQFPDPPGSTRASFLTATIDLDEDS